MDDMGEKTIVIAIRKAPYGLMYGFEALRAIMGISIFEMSVVPVLMDDGVFTLMRDQDPSAIGMNPISDSFENLDDFGVHAVYAHHESLTSRGLSEKDIVTGITIINTDEIRRIFDSADLILPF